ncbi:hypothetical protein BOX15_Mlig021267g3 [Macrostomum lignano]|uniref:Phosphoinositide phospholipase C n=1 Tax=Macrostomum lignano TaxID=282301 RepID=A0A267GAK3_9PLAT|nr:hypothetical protein BOX15_Mlig021267g3 [Macrostomum lignano]
MEVLLALLPAPVYYAVIAGFLLTCLQLFGPDICWALSCLWERGERLGIRHRVHTGTGLAALTHAFTISTEPSLVPLTLPLLFEIGEDEDDRKFAYLGKRGGWKPAWIEFEQHNKSLVLRKLRPSAASIAKNKTRKIVALESLQRISAEAADNDAEYSPDSPIAVSLHRSASEGSWPLRLLARSPQAACRWLQQLLVNLLSVRPDLSVPRPLVTEQALTDRLKLVCQAEAPSFSVDLLALLLKEFGVFAKRTDLKSFLQKTMNKQKIETYRETMDAAKEVLGQMAGLEIFQRYATGKSNGSLITVPDFHQNFATNSQGLRQNLAETLNQLRSIATVDSNLLDLMLITRRLFKDILASKIYTLPLRTDQLELRQPLSQPMTDYFISTSHNTYLMEDQLKGRSDCLAYEIALKKNCRCVELDIHNGPNGDPIITHGGTMTSRIRFEDVIKTIKRFAFVASEYPLILSFENHCSLEQQDKMAQILTKHLKDYLYVDESSDHMERLPSPEELKWKIIIKNKKTQQEPGASATFYVAATAPTASPQAANAAACTEDDSDGDESDGEVSNSSPASSPQGGRRSISGPMASAEGDIAGGASGSESSDLQASPPMPPNRRSSIDKSVSVGGPTVAASAATAVGAMGKKRKKLKVSTSLSDMVSICRPVKFKGQKYARENYRPVEMSSLTESKVEKKQWLKKDGEDANRMVLHTQYQLVRVYPSGLRTNSSNYNPINAWRLGCQLVALNYQTRCENMELNDGLFQLNGSCGYVPKPAILTEPDTKFNPFSPSPELALSLRLEIISGVNLRQPASQQEQQLHQHAQPPLEQQQQQQLQCQGASERTDSSEEKTASSPYVKVTLFGVPGDEKKDQTKKADQGFNPHWLYRCFEDNEVVRVPELAHLRLEVKDKSSGKVIGQFTAPLTAFNKGYRRVNLKDSRDSPTASELWIYIELR